MNWEERIDNVRFSIQTGDGETYFPLFKGGEKDKEFNTSTFEFINVYGTLVDRKKPKGGKFNLVFWFEGSENIDQAERFEVSCDDPRAWKVTHPYYGVIVGQPMSIKRDNNNLNITEITVPFYETIELDYPFINYSPKDNTRDKHQAVLKAFTQSAVNNVEYEPIDTQKNFERMKDIESEMKVLQNDNTYSDFQNALNTGLKAIDKITEFPLNAIEKVQAFLDLPATYEQAVLGRIGSYINVYYRLKTTIQTVADKKYFESLGGTIIASIGLASVLPLDGDYYLIGDVFNVSDQFRAVYNDYVETLDRASISIYDVNNAYSPDPIAQLELSLLVNYTLSNLYNLSFEAKRERIAIVNEKTNIILLTHKYLGLDADDENINIFVKTNNIKLNELFSIDKGREIKYAK